MVCLQGTDRRTSSKRKFALSNGGKSELGLERKDQSEDSRHTKDEAKLLNQEVYCSIAGSDASTSSAMHLHYGPSSTFVVLQQLYRFLLGSPGSKQMIINQHSGNCTAEAISEFGYTSIFFGRDAGWRCGSIEFHADAPKFQSA